MRYFVIALCLSLVLLPAIPAFAQDDDPCSRLSPDRRKQVDEILGSRHCYDCCDRTIAACLGLEPRCRLALRLERFVCRLVDKGKTTSEIEKALNDRALSMMEAAAATKIDLENATRIGDATAPVKVTIYLCVRCPFCSKLFPLLHNEVVGGALKGKVELVVKLFPIKGHAGSVEAALAAMAARDQGKMDRFLLHAYKGFDAFDLEILPSWAQEVELEMDAYRKAVEAPATRESLVASKKEGIANKVKATPTLFIDGRLYQGLMDHETLVDVMLEEFERKTGEIYE